MMESEEGLGEGANTESERDRRVLCMEVCSTDQIYEGIRESTWLDEEDCRGALDCGGMPRRSWLCGGVGVERGERPGQGFCDPLLLRKLSYKFISTRRAKINLTQQVDQHKDKISTTRRIVFFLVSLRIRLQLSPNKLIS